MTNNGFSGKFLILLSLPLVIILINLIALGAYRGDDAFIHFTFVRNLVERGVFSYNTPSPTYGSTSILWVLIVAAGSFLVGDIPTAARVLSALLYIASAAGMIYYLKVRFSGNFATVSFLACSFLLNAVSFRWLLTGMETSLVLATTVAILLWYDQNRPGLTGIICLLAFLIRPEFILLPVAHCVLGISLRPKAVVSFLLITVFLFALWFTAAWYYFGRIVPLTLVKSSGSLDAGSLLRFAKTLAGFCPVLLIAAGTVLIRYHRKAVQLLSPATPQERVLVLYAGLVLMFYLVTGTTVLSRYLIGIHVPLFLLFLGALQSDILRRQIRLWAGTAVVVQVVLFVVVHRPAIDSFVSGFQQTYERIGREVRVTGESDTGAVMLGDVGMVGYFSGRPVIDTQGLTSEQVYASGTHDEGTLAGEFHPRFIVARLDTTSLESYTTRLRAKAPAIEKIDVLMHEQIPGLGVLTRTSWDTYLLAVAYSSHGTVTKR